MGIRAFLAVPVPDEVRRAISDLTRGLGKKVPGARFVKPDQVHLTLHFFESLDPGEVEAVRTAARAGAALAQPYEVSLSGLGVFPDERRPRVLWIGVREGADETARLARLVGAELGSRGLPVESRPFRPHLTLARFREPDPRGVAAALAGGAGVSVPPFHAGTIVLFRSDLGPGGAVHTAIDESPLGSAGSHP